MENICRCCLKPTAQHSYSFNDRLTDHEKVQEYFEQFTSIRIQDFHSKICKQCFEDLKFVKRFQKKCLENNLKYEKLMGNSESQEIQYEILIKQEEVVSEPIVVNYQIEAGNPIKQENPENIPAAGKSTPVKQRRTRKTDPGKLTQKKKVKSKLIKYKDIKGPSCCSYCGKEFKDFSSRLIHERQASFRHLILFVRSK